MAAPPSPTNLLTFKLPTYSSCPHLPAILSATHLPSHPSTYLSTHPTTYTPSTLPTCQQGKYLPNPTYQVINWPTSSSIAANFTTIKNDDGMENMRVLQKN